MVAISIMESLESFSVLLIRLFHIEIELKIGLNWYFDATASIMDQINHSTKNRQISFDEIYDI